MIPLAELIGESPGIVAVRQQIGQLLERHPATRRLPPLLLLGETGTGKGLLARAIHRAGPRAAGPFVAINCAAIPETLLEAELFGYERGAFTDARHAKAGLFQTAHRGTLFLDEIALLPEGLQAKLLTALEDRVVRRLGATRDEPVDVWLLAAASEDLERAVRARRFRPELYHRLAVVTLRLPPLRERRQDIPLLGGHFLARTCADYGLPLKTLSDDARAALLAYPWPGNVRELANVMERAALLAEAPVITAPLLGLPARDEEPGSDDRGEQTERAPALEPARLLEALRETGWNVSRAAARLGVGRDAVRYQIRKHALRPDPSAGQAAPRPLPAAAGPVIREPFPTVTHDAPRPLTRYAKSGAVHIAYQVCGDGPFDLVLVPGFVSHLEYIWEHPWPADFVRRLASFSRLIRFDKRGTGLSDRSDMNFTLEQRMEDVKAVMDAVGSQRAALFGYSEGGPMSLLFAATYPERTAAVAIYGSYARRAWAPDYPFGRTDAQLQRILTMLEEGWGGPVGLDIFAPSAIEDEPFRRWWASWLRLGGSPGAALTLTRMNQELDARHVLPAIRVPTLIVHRRGDRLSPVEHARYMAARIPQAKLVELDGIDHLPMVGNTEAVLDAVEEFLTESRPITDDNRVLLTVLCIDVVDSTRRALASDDTAWGALLGQYRTLVRRQLHNFRGRGVDTAGDGFLATFDGPARAIRCACAVVREAGESGLQLRAGLHTGECEIVGDKVSGIALHVAARVAAAARPGEVFVSRTVRDLVAGSGIAFEERGPYALEGVSGEWHLFAVDRGSGSSLQLSA